MSQENVEALKRAADAYNRRDVDALLDELDPEVEWHPAMPEALMGRGPAVYRGHRGIRSMFADLYDSFAELHIDLSEIRDLGDRTVAIGRLRTRGKESGAQTESPWAGVAEHKNAKFVRIWTYLDPEDVLEAAGLRE
jgi:ketosteroid isomerase-like protein